METVVLLHGEKVDGHVEIDLDVDKPGRKSGTATYTEIKAYIEEKYGFKVSTGCGYDFAIWVNENTILLFG